ncbi:macro domain-containing protein [Streptomyces sp. NPDC048462]|uniref:type II toxin-antitoxin system antitoxin DNA ADP-ribosyl glycohydrolase DarG n=1 Tax=Streptomyces sp. NPDC048462 TaxID=3365555 RepID=UPI003710E0F4
MSTSGRNVRVLQGDLLKSQMHGLVNTVNTVGVMGKGIALSFKRKYPEMYADYVQRCRAGQVRLGEPYPYRAGDHLIINFPTKGHWRSVSKLDDIIAGLDYLAEHCSDWGLKSLAVPPLGCGAGQLEWSVVGPVLAQRLEQLDIPVELYAPFDVEVGHQQLDLWEKGESSTTRFVEPWQYALVEVLNRLEQQPYRHRVGRVMFQKIAYFAVAAGIPMDLQHEKASYGPFSPQLKPTIAKLQNNGLIAERQLGNMFEVNVGQTFNSSNPEYAPYLEKWDSAIAVTCDLVARFDSAQAEIAATVHYSAEHLYRHYGRIPTASEILNAVEAWKVRRKPPLKRDEVVRSIVHLATLGWISAEPDESVADALAELSLA